MHLSSVVHPNLFQVQPLIFARVKSTAAPATPTTSTSGPSPSVPATPRPSKRPTSFSTVLDVVELSSTPKKLSRGNFFGAKSWLVLYGEIYTVFLNTHAKLFKIEMTKMSLVNAKFRLRQICKNSNTKPNKSKHQIMLSSHGLIFSLLQKRKNKIT